MKLSREFKIGVIFLISVVVLFLGLNFLKGKDVFNRQATFYVVYDNVNGLVASNPVLLNGIRIGQVSGVSFDPSTTDKIIVELSIDYSDIAFPVNSSARLMSDIMGSKSIDVILGNAKEYAADGDTLTALVQASLQAEVHEQLKPLKIKTESLISSVDTLLTTIQMVLNKNTRDNLQQSFDNIKSIVENLKSTTFSIDTLVTTQRNRLERIVANVESITYNVKNSNEQVRNIINNFSAISDSLAQADIAHTLEQTDKTLTNLNNITGRISKGEGSLGLLLNNDSLYNNLESAARDLDRLLIDLKENPERYVHFSLFGSGKGKKKKN